MKLPLGLLLSFVLLSCSVLVRKNGKETTKKKVENTQRLDSFSSESALEKQTSTPFIDISRRTWGLYDFVQGEVSVPAIYDRIYPYKNGCYVVRKNELEGIIDQHGRELLPIVHYAVLNYEDLIVVRKNGLLGAFDYDLKEILPIEYSSIEYVSDLIVAEKNNKYGVLNKSKDTIVPFEYDVLSKNKGLFGDLIFAMKDGKYGLLDDNNRKILPIEYDFLSMSGTEYVAVLQNGKYGIYDYAGKQIVKVRWHDLAYLGSSFFAVKNESGLYGIINIKEKLIQPFQYKSLEFSQDGIFTYRGKGRYEAINLDNKEIITHSFSPFYFSEGIAAVSVLSERKIKYGYRDINGVSITPFKYDDAKPFTNGFGRITLNNKHGYVDTNGNEVIPPLFDFISEPFDGMVFVRQKEKYHLRTMTNKRVSEAEYDYISFEYQLEPEHKNYILARKGNLHGFINFEGKEVIPFIYENARNFSGDFASVLLGGKLYLIDKKGARIDLSD